jgi:MFS family permease
MASPTSLSPHVAWWRQLTGYHWFVMIVASAAWFFDCLDQRLFSLARIPALSALMEKSPGDPAVQEFGKYVTAYFLIGWGIGGMVFGALGDRYGRAKMLTATVLLYSVFTGLSYFSQTAWDFTLFRFLTGVGVGGVFGLAVALIAETVPDGARAGALGTLQVLSTVGNMTAGLCKYLIDRMETAGTISSGNGWRFMFLVGALPALMVILIQRYLKEPEPWLRMKAAGKLPKGWLLAPYIGLLSSKRWRKNLVIGAVIASTGVVGLWAIGEYSYDLQKTVFRDYYASELVAQGKIAATDVDGAAANDLIRPLVENARTWAYWSSMMGAAVGMALFTKLASYGRKLAFGIGFSLALVITVLTYWKMASPRDAYWMMFLMTGSQLAVFAGFAIYLPELFPSRLRSTGVSFCYNIGRFAAAGGSFFSAGIATSLYGGYGSPLMQRYAAMTMCAIFLAGLVVLFWAPETKGKPLPEEDDGD